MTATAEAAKTSGRPLPKSGRALCLVLFALAWFQLSYASHQFEHVAGDVTGACVVCTQMERLDGAVVQNAADFAVAEPAGVAVTATGSPFQAVPVRRYETRAPPAV